MADEPNFIFSVVMGKFRIYAELPGTNDAIIAIPIEAAGIEADATMSEHTTLASLLAGTTNEQTTMGRKTVTGAVVLPDATLGVIDYDCDDILWPEADGNACAAAVFAYVPNVGVSTDAETIPMAKWVWNVVPNGNDTLALIAPEGYARSQ